MFSVYSVTGQSFRGSLEKLVAIPGLSAARRSRGINQEGEELGPEMRVFQRDHNEDGQYQKAAQAYRQMLRVSTERTPILHTYQLMSRDVMTLRPDTRVEDASVNSPRVAWARRRYSIKHCGWSAWSRFRIC